MSWDAEVEEGRLELFVPRVTNTAERNYDVIDHELLAMKDALSEWRHWLDRSA